ncbi:MAG: hypothetical protein ACRDHP_08785 [Ktedonobacterales bacterium]
MVCHKGWFVLTDEYASLLPRGTLRRKPRWFIQRATIAGVSLRRDLAGYTVSIRTQSGHDLPLTRVHPLDALRLAKLLGYAAAPLTQARGSPAGQQSVARAYCQGGRIEFSGKTLAFIPALRVRRAASWEVAIDRISGVSCLRQPGPRMLHDVEIHTRNGRTLQVRRVRPDAALRLLDALGYIPGSLPEQPLDQRDALEMQFAIPDHDDEDEAPPGLPAIRTGTNAPIAQRSVRRDLDDLWARQRTTSIA